MATSKKMYPSTYTKNSGEETEILSLAENFQRQFKLLYPNKPVPPIYFKNECGIQKVVCTSLCPSKTVLPVEITQWEASADFIADYMDYIILDPPVLCPQILPSVSSILKRRKGNSLEISMLLCTFLLSSGYDAYVIQGYASKVVTNKTKSKEPKWLVQASEECAKPNVDTSYKKSHLADSKYYSDFLKFKAFWEGKKIDFDEDFKEPPIEVQKEFDAMHGKRIHFWVLIRDSENGFKECFFIESTIGEKKLTDSEDYLGIECAWNNKNFWCTKKGSHFREISFDFNDQESWEAFLPEFIFDQDLNVDIDNFIRMPRTWVQDIEVTQYEVDNRLPMEGRQYQFKTAKQEKYNPQIRKDGLVERIICYRNEECIDSTESHSWYKKRCDKLEYRKTDFVQNIVSEEFANGRPDALKQRTYHLKNDPTFTQTMTFLSYLRKDKLVCRKWTETMSVDSFINRSDYLCSREIYYSDITSVLHSTDEGAKEFPSEVESEGQDIRKEKVAENEMNDSPSLRIVPYMFRTTDCLFQGIDLSCWNFRDFLENIDPAERYASSESEEDSDIESDEDETEKFHVKGIAEPIIPQSSSTLSDDANELNFETEGDIMEDGIQPDFQDDEEELPKESEFESELELFDEINFDALSDEELEIDYQIFLVNLWDEYFNLEKTDIFYIEKEFEQHKDIRKKKTLTLKKKIINKRRKNERYIQRLEKGKPNVRVYKLKSLDKPEDQVSRTANDLIQYLDLNEKLEINRVSDLNEFYVIDKSEGDLMDDIKNEVIKAEALKHLDKTIKRNLESKKFIPSKRISLIKIEYFKDPDNVLEHTIRNIWFDLDTGTYRLDFHYPERRSSCMSVIFPKLEPGKIECHFPDNLIRQIISSSEIKRIDKPRLYSYNVALIKKEPQIRKEITQFDEQIQKVLKTRQQEELYIQSKASVIHESKSDIVSKEILTSKRLGSEGYSANDDLQKPSSVRLLSAVTHSKATSASDILMFCDRADEKFNLLKREFEAVRNEYEVFLRKCKSWKGDWTQEHKDSFSKAWGKAYGLISCMKLQCEEQCKLLVERYSLFKEKCYSVEQVKEQ